jgi:cytochrome b involved in lipid metabolism
MKTVFALLFALSVASAFPKLRRRLQVTESQLAAANSASNCWLAIGGRAYDCTAYANSNQHPGGARTIHAQCGNDVTTKFNNEGAHKRSFLDSRVTDLGPLVADPVNPITPPANPTPCYRTYLCTTYCMGQYRCN